MQECKFQFREMTCEEFAATVQRPGAPVWARQFANIFCMNDTAVEIQTISVSSNSKDLKSVIDAVNVEIRTETLAIANKKGIESPAIPEYTIGELFNRYNYRCYKVRSKWYKHVFTLKPIRQA